MLAEIDARPSRTVPDCAEFSCSGRSQPSVGRKGRHRCVVRQAAVTKSRPCGATSAVSRSTQPTSAASAWPERTDEIGARDLTELVATARRGACELAEAESSLRKERRTMPTYIPRDVVREDRPDGSILLRSRPARPVVRNMGAWLHRWAQEAPDAAYLRSGVGWSRLARGRLRRRASQVRSLASSLVGRGAPDRETPIVRRPRAPRARRTIRRRSALSTPRRAVFARISRRPIRASIRRVETVRPKNDFSRHGAAYEAASRYQFPSTE